MKRPTDKTKFMGQRGGKLQLSGKSNASRICVKNQTTLVICPFDTLVIYVIYNKSLKAKTGGFFTCFSVHVPRSKCSKFQTRLTLDSLRIDRQLFI